MPDKDRDTYLLAFWGFSVLLTISLTSLIILVNIHLAGVTPAKKRAVEYIVGSTDALAAVYIIYFRRKINNFDR